MGRIWSARAHTLPGRSFPVHSEDTRCATSVRRRGRPRFPVSEISRHSNGEPACAIRCTGRTPPGRDRATRRIADCQSPSHAFRGRRASCVALAAAPEAGWWLLARCSGRDVAGPNCASISTLLQAARSFDLAMTRRARKLIGMTQDDHSSFPPRPGRIHDRRPPWPATAAVRHPGDCSRRRSRRAGL
jgi:hypothetical protein